MKKSILGDTLKRIGGNLSKYSPEILTGLGVAGMVTTVILAVRATPKAFIIIEEEKKQKSTEKITVGDAIKLCYKFYIPTAVMGATSIACIVGASSMRLHRNTALAAAYTLSETAIKEYQEKVVETIGENKEKLIKESVDKSKMENDPVSKKEVIITEKGNTLCYDSLSGRYFKSDIDILKKIENDINYRIINEPYVSLNDLYYEIGLKPVEIGDVLGWNTGIGKVEFEYGATIADDGTPCLVINHKCMPSTHYTDF